ncbi:sigma-70 family RNA polymerase sigma factor [Planctomycetota bacterium]
MNKNLMKELLAHRRELFGFIRAMVLSSTDADDIFQEVALVVMEKEEKSEEIRNFRAWSFEIARRKIHEFFRTERGKGREQMPTMEMESLIADIYTNYSPPDYKKDEEHEALRACMGKLREKHRNLLRMRFIENMSYEEISNITRKSGEALRQALSRIRKSLVSCIERVLGASGTGI